MTRRRHARDFERKNGRAEQRVRNMVRRMLVRAGEAVAWTLRGHLDEDGQAETARAEVFAHVGFASRPGGAGAEAIVLTVDASANHPVIVATRDLATERAVIDQIGLGAGETLVFTAKRIIKLTSDGDILIGSVGASGEDFKAVALADHTHRAPEIVGQAQYVDPEARTSGPDSVSEHLKVT